MGYLLNATFAEQSPMQMLVKSMAFTVPYQVIGLLAT